MIKLSRRTVIAALPLSAAAAVLPGTSPASTSPLPSVDAADDVAQSFLSPTAPGMSVSVSHRGAAVHCKGYGLANVEHDVPVHADTVFQTGSVGKMFTATLALLLERDGLLDIDAPVTAYLDDAPDAYRRLTSRHLLTHVGGVKNYDGLIDITREFGDDELLGEIYELGFDFPPEEAWAYSNSGFLLMGLVLARVAGKSYGELLDERIFTPAGMKTARIIAPEADIVPHRAAGYTPNEEGELKNQWYASTTFLRTGDGAIYASARDMLAWGLALRSNEILTAEEYRKLTTPTPQSAAAGDNGGGGYGMGMSVSTSGPYTVHAHGGAWQGFLAYFLRVPEADLIVTVNANSSAVDTAAAARKIAAIWAPDLPAASG